jgi:thermitase
MRTLIRKSSFQLLLVVLTLLFGSQSALSQSMPRHGLSNFADDTVLVRFNPGAPAAEIAKAHTDTQGFVVRSFDAIGVKVIRVPKGSASNAVERYRRNPNVEFADLNYRRTIFLPTTNEGAEPGLGVANNFDEQYGLHNTGQQFGASLDPIFGALIYPTYTATAGADINAPEGWAITHGSSTVGIAVLDSGIACDHLDLTGKCIEQVNFVGEHGSSLADELGHGTHVAGIAAATTDNGVGIAGVGRDTRVGSLKTCWEDYSLFFVVIGQCDDDDVIEAITYATDATYADGSPKYKVISMSFAGPVISDSVEVAVDRAWNNGLVLVAGAGNDYTQDILYPAAFANVIGVGSTDFHDNLSGFSTFGQWVSVLAPGTHILSTVPGAACGQPAGEPSDCYDYKSGTSMSTPHVSGLAALLWAQNPTATNGQIRSLIENGADETGALGQNLLAWSAHGRINMAGSLGSTAEPTTHHVQSVTVSTVSAGKGRKSGQAVVTVVDDFGSPLNGATVHGAFSGSFDETVSGTTTASGSVTFTTTATAKGGVAFTFCVSNVTHAATTYNDASNNVTCSSL